ncbi:MAG: pilus assembly protein PilM, partial [Bdellovibrionota bacterium]
MKSVGIDIGTHSIKAVEIDTTGKSFYISNSHYFPLSQRAGQDQLLEIIEILRSFVLNFDPLTTKFNVALRQDMVTVRHKIFPFVEKMKIARTLPLELEDDLPFDSDQLVFD